MCSVFFFNEIEKLCSVSSPSPQTPATNLHFNKFFPRFYLLPSDFVDNDRIACDVDLVIPFPLEFNKFLITKGLGPPLDTKELFVSGSSEPSSWEMRKVMPEGSRSP
jgi:hypothetical protein